MNVLSIIYLRIIYFAYAISKRSTIFKYYFFISITCTCTCSCCVWDSCSSLNMYVCITIIVIIYLNLMSLSASSFISTQFLVLNFDCSFDVLSNKFIISYVPLFYYYMNIRSSINFCLSSGNIYLSLGISLSC